MKGVAIGNHTLSGFFAKGRAYWRHILIVMGINRGEDFA